MIAALLDPAAPGGLRVATAPAPRPGPGQVLIDARWAGLNRADLGGPGPASAGSVAGTDVAGIITRTAPGGPPVGTAVVALTTGALAPTVIADVTSLSIVPDGLDLAVAAALPRTGLAALQAVRAGTLETPVKAARVLITGASGGVGRLAVQLAALGGAHVIAITSRPAAHEALRDLGADEVLTDPSQVDEPVDLVLDTVGGRQLVAAWRALAPGASCQCIGWSSGEPATFPPDSLAGRAGASRSLISFQVTGPIAADLESLLGLVDDGRLEVEIGWRGPLAKAADAAQALRERRVTGRVVLSLGR